MNTENTEIDLIYDRLESIEEDLTNKYNFRLKCKLEHYKSKQEYILNMIEYRIGMIKINNEFIEQTREIIKNTTNVKKLKNKGENICITQFANNEYTEELKLLQCFYNKYFFDGAEKFYV